MCESNYTSRGEVLHWHGIHICACLLEPFFARFGIPIGGFSSGMKEPKLKNWVYFEQIIVKKHPFELGTFLSKMVYWWVGNLTKGIEKVRFSKFTGKSTYDFGEGIPSGLYLCSCFLILALFYNNFINSNGFLKLCSSKLRISALLL